MSHILVSYDYFDIWIFIPYMWLITVLLPYHRFYLCVYFEFKLYFIFLDVNLLNFEKKDTGFLYCDNTMSMFICNLRRFELDDAVFIDRTFYIPKGCEIVALAHEDAGLRPLFTLNFV